jgi:hypothetical protein
VDQGVVVGHAVHTVGALDRDLVLVGLLGDDVDHTGHRIVAPEIRQCAAHHLDVVDLLLGDLLPEDLAVVRIDQGNAVDENQGAAGSGRAEIAQRHALRLGVEIRAGDGTARAAVETESGDGAQNVVDGDIGGEYRCPPGRAR